MFDEATLQRLYRYAFALTGTEWDAHDLLQDSIERFLRRDREGLDRSEWYLMRLMRNHMIDGHRRRRNEASKLALVASCTETRFDALHVENRAELENVWQQLCARDRELLLLSVSWGYSAAEISEYLDCPRGTILSRLHRLQARIERMLEPACDKLRVEARPS